MFAPALWGQDSGLLVNITLGRLFSCQTLINCASRTVVSTSAREYVVRREMTMSYFCNFVEGGAGLIAFLWSANPVFLLATRHPSTPGQSPYAVSFKNFVNGKIMMEIITVTMVMIDDIRTGP